MLSNSRSLLMMINNQQYALQILSLIYQNTDTISFSILLRSVLFIFSAFLNFCYFIFRPLNKPSQQPSKDLFHDWKLIGINNFIFISPFCESSRLFIYKETANQYSKISNCNYLKKQIINIVIFREMVILDFIDS